MSRFWSDIVHNLTPYVPGEQPKIADLIKLNTNENPYGPSPKALAAIQAATDDTLRLYPDPNSDKLKQAIATAYDLQPSQVFVGNGSDEVLAIIFQALFKHAAPLLFPDITYSFYPVYGRLYGIEYRQLPLTESFEISIDDYLQSNGGIIFPNPNAPTGRFLAVSEIERLLKKNSDSAVVIDEAYVDFGGESCAPLIKQYPNLLVVHTLSKSRALAGLRVGYALGDGALIEGLNRVKDSFNSYPLDRLAQAGATAAVEDQAWLKASCDKVIASRTKLVADLQAMSFTVLPSAANFIFARHLSIPGADIATQLRTRGIILRHFNRPARIAPYLRISIGTDAECDALIAALREML